MKVNNNNLLNQYEMYQNEYEQRVIEVLRSGWYVLGNQVASFEKEFAKYIGVKYSVGLASGLDALILAFRALDIHEGDEVIVQANTYIASVMGITINGAIPVFVEPDEYYNMDANKIEEKISNKTKAILVVHLYGQATNMNLIHELCKKHKLYLVEDCAQSHGAAYDGVMTGSISDIGCWSFYPSKNLGAFGDGGAITTNNQELADKIKILRNYGSEKRYHNKVVGYNSRLDEIQAGLLRVKLNHIEELLEDRKRIANMYNQHIDNPLIKLPTIQENCTHVWHLYVIRCLQRDKLFNYLVKHDVQPLIHYPIPPHLSEAYSYLGYKEGDFSITERYANEVLTLPLYNGMPEAEIKYVIDVINKYER